MTRIASAFSALATQQQSLVLSIYAFELTILARNGYEAGTEQLSNPQLVRRLNEVQHRVTSAIVSRLKCDEQRYPDDVLIGIIVGNDNDKNELGPLLRSSFLEAWRLVFGVRLENGQ